MKALRIVLISGGCLIGIFILAAVSYRVFFSQGVAESFEVNSPELETRVLIATQGSSFKKTLVSGIIDDLGENPMYIKVVDVTALPEIEEKHWDALILIATCQSDNLQSDVKDYLSRTKKPDNIVLLATSGSGNWKPEQSPVDSISSASKKNNAGSLVADILKRVRTILGNR